ncbi:MAG: hypothetical protein J5867_11470, partial [Prevotella sp.]|nr:hypothetical protein [Prevotella sp.]
MEKFRRLTTIFRQMTTGTGQMTTKGEMGGCTGERHSLILQTDFHFKLTIISNFRSCARHGFQVQKNNEKTNLDIGLPVDGNHGCERTNQQGRP